MNEPMNSNAFWIAYSEVFLLLTGIVVFERHAERAQARRQDQQLSVRMARILGGRDSFHPVRIFARRNLDGNTLAER
jgi:hypothetical protein